MFFIKFVRLYLVRTSEVLQKLNQEHAMFRNSAEIILDRESTLNLMNLNINVRRDDLFINLYISPVSKSRNDDLRLFSEVFMQMWTSVE